MQVREQTTQKDIWLRLGAMLLGAPLYVPGNSLYAHRSEIAPGKIVEASQEIHFILPGTTENDPGSIVFSSQEIRIYNASHTKPRATENDTGY
jgi:hypothetical protein